MREEEAFGWPSIKTSYTRHRGKQGYLIYRGALRRDADKSVMWECEHEHTARGYNDNDGALRCANQEHWRRSRAATTAAPEPPRSGLAGGEMGGEGRQGEL